jgi:hypothetical protein
VLPEHCREGEAQAEMLCRQNKASPSGQGKKERATEKATASFERLPTHKCVNNAKEHGQNREHEAEAAHLRRREREQISGKCLIIA